MISITTLDEIQRIKKPSRIIFDACRLMCNFVNTFRSNSQKWPAEAFSSWVTVHHFLVGSPSIAKIYKEIIATKKMFIRPFRAKMTPALCTELITIRENFLQDQNKSFCLR